MRLLLIFTVVFLIIGCESKIPPDKIEPIPKIDVKAVEKPEPLFEERAEDMQVSKRNYVLGEWMAYSKSVYYDDGEFKFAEPKGLLYVNDDGTWEFGNLNGKWEVSAITEDDWKIWDVSPYGHKKKITLYGWNGDIASGPIEGEATPQFIWVIYRSGPPFEDAPSQVQMKFGWT